jgi:chemotaxis protein methyltransferase CheR
VSPERECVAFLQWALPRIGRRWAGYRKVRRQVCRRVRRRAGELGCASLADYRARLERDPCEWIELDALTNITISRFYRDRGVFAFLESDVLPALAASARDAGRAVVRAWSAGCASGEEPFTLAIVWERAVAADAELQITATDTDPALLRRAAEGRYPRSALRELPESRRDAAFARDGDELVIASRFRRTVTLERRDIRAEPPRGPFDLVLCRYLAFTYFDDARQRETVRRLASVTAPGAALVLGTHEGLPDGEPGFERWAPHRGVFRRAG